MKNDIIEFNEYRSAGDGIDALNDLYENTDPQDFKDTVYVFLLRAPIGSHIEGRGH